MHMQEIKCMFKSGIFVYVVFVPAPNFSQMKPILQI